MSPPPSQAIALKKVDPAPCCLYNGKILRETEGQDVVKDIEEAAEAAKSQSTDRHINRGRTKLLGAHLPEELVTALGLVARQKGITIKDMLEQFAREQVKDVLPRSARERILEVNIKQCKKSLGL